MKQKTVISVTLDFDIYRAKILRKGRSNRLAFHIQVGSGLMPRTDVTVIHSKAPNTKKIQELMHLLKLDLRQISTGFLLVVLLRLWMRLKKQINAGGERPREK